MKVFERDGPDRDEIYCWRISEDPPTDSSLFPVLRQEYDAKHNQGGIKVLGAVVYHPTTGGERRPRKEERLYLLRKCDR